MKEGAQVTDQSEEILIYMCQENSRGVVTGIATDDWTVAEKTRQSHHPWSQLRPEMEPCER